MEENKSFGFKINISSVGEGYVFAKDAEDARERIKEGEWDDIYDEVDKEFGDIIDLWIEEE